MKYAILGDIHSNLEALTAVLAKAAELKVDSYVCIGDVVGYNANPRECLEILRDLKPEAVVKGNHDDYVANLQLDLYDFNPQAAQAVKWTRSQINEEERLWLEDLPYTKDIIKPGGVRFQLVHGTLDNPRMWGYIFDRYSAETSLQYQSLPLCFCGHTHTPMLYVKSQQEVTASSFTELRLMPNHKYLINVGSVGQPRDGDTRAAFVTYDTRDNTVVLHRIPYDIETCQQKILDADLPSRLAERLGYGC